MSREARIYTALEIDQDADGTRTPVSLGSLTEPARVLLDNVVPVTGRTIAAATNVDIWGQAGVHGIGHLDFLWFECDRASAGESMFLELVCDANAFASPRFALEAMRGVPIILASERSYKSWVDAGTSTVIFSGALDVIDRLTVRNPSATLGATFNYVLGELV